MSGPQLIDLGGRRVCGNTVDHRTTWKSSVKNQLNSHSTLSFLTKAKPQLTDER